MSKKKSEDQPPMPAMDRLAKKVAAFGDDAPLELDEVAAYWGLGVTATEKIIAELNVAAPLPRVRRWRFGDIKRQFLEMVTEPTF